MNTYAHTLKLVMSIGLNILKHSFADASISPYICTTDISC